MTCKVDYKDCKGIVRDWIWVKYQVLNKCVGGISLRLDDGKTELFYDSANLGAALFFDDSKFDQMKMAGYFVGRPGRYMGEGSATITEKAVEELRMEQKKYTEESQKLLEKGFKLFMEAKEIDQEVYDAIEFYKREEFQSGMEWEAQVGRRRRFLSEIYGLYLIPEKEIQNIEAGSILVSSVDAKEIIYDGELNWDINDGYSIYGVRLMPMFVDDRLL